MARIKQGVIGPFSGGVGELVGSSWNGIPYVRSYAATIGNPRSDLQQDHRQKIAVTMKFLKPLAVFLRTGFKNYAIRMSGINAAMSWNYRNALKGSYPGNGIDYPKVLVARGELAPALNPAAASNAKGTVNFKWDNNSGEKDANASDKTLLVVYNPAKYQAVTASELGQRADRTQTVTVPGSFSGDLVQCYIAFIAADGQVVSNSVFAGAVTAA